MQQEYSENVTCLFCHSSNLVPSSDNTFLTCQDCGEKSLTELAYESAQRRALNSLDADLQKMMDNLTKD